VNEDFNSYKDFFSNRNERFFAIDAIACQPNLLKLIFNEKGIAIEDTYLSALKGDFYNYIILNSKIKDRNLGAEEARKCAKDLYCVWQNGGKKK